MPAEDEQARLAHVPLALVREAMKWEQTDHQYSSLPYATAEFIEELEGEEKVRAVGQNPKSNKDNENKTKTLTPNILNNAT